MRSPSDSGARAATTRRRGCPRSRASSSDGAAASDRFLYDYRRTIAELFARSTTARSRPRLTDVAWSTTPRRWKTAARSSATTSPCGRTPTCRWVRCGRSTPTSGPRPTYVADLKGAASVAHVYGKAWTGAEAFTSFDRPWASSPRSLKHVADLQLTPRGHAVLHPHVAAPAARRAAAGHRPRAVPRAGLHRQRDLGGDGAAVDRLPRPLLGGAVGRASRRSTSRCSSARRRR